MSEVYLTKIKRRTIFTKSLIFVLIMFIISDLTVTGPFWFNFIPWLYILGTIGSMRKIDGVLMSIIGTFTVFVASTISWGGVYFPVIIDTVVALLSLVLGVITGKILFEFVLEHRLVKYIKHSKKVIYISAAVGMFLLSYAVVALNSGNIIAYLKSKSNLKKYIENTYNINEYDIVKTKYNGQVPGKYTYMVKINGQEVKFVPFTEDTFKDANRETRFIHAQHDLEAEVGGKIDKIVNKYSNLKGASVNFKIVYNDFSINSNVVALYFKCNTDEYDEDLDKLYDQVTKCVQELYNIKEAQRIIITIDNKTMQLSNENIHKLDKEYIKGGFQIEELSD